MKPHVRMSLSVPVGANWKAGGGWLCLDLALGRGAGWGGAMPKQFTEQAGRGVRPNASSTATFGGEKN